MTDRLEYAESPSVDIGLLVARVFLSAVFVYSGVSKALNYSLAIEEFEALDIPLASFAVIAVIAIQLVGAFLVLTGLRLRMGAALLAVFTFAATLIGHAFWNHDGAEFQRHLTIALEHLSIIGGFIALTMTGPGRYVFPRKNGRP